MHRPKFFTSINLLLYRVLELALRSSPNFLKQYIYDVLQNHCFRVEFFALFFFYYYISVIFK